MKPFARLVSGLGLAALARADAEHASSTPMERVAQLLVQMKNRVEADGMLEQQSYDKYACWCEETTARKAKDIARDKEIIEQTQAEIIKLEAEVASHQAEIKQTKKEITENLEAQREATALRDKENAEYAVERTESEQCSGALEAAIKVLTGAGEKKKAFLETGAMQEAQLLSVVAGVRSVLSKPSIMKELPDGDLRAVQRFLEHPEEFVGSRAGGMLSAVQIVNNPFGDYAPQSTQIQGILKSMYDTFVGDLEKSNAEEAEAQKAFEELMATKQKELQTLQDTLQQHELDEAEKSKALAEANQINDDTKVQLAADEKLFEDVKAGCKAKSTEWSQRSLLRSQELMGINQAISILTSPEARAKFQSAVTTFVQVGAVSRHRSGLDAAELGVRSAKLSALAQKYHNFGLAQIAVQMRSGGHFDKVIAAIDQMMEVLRREEQDDIAHRDRCQNAQNKNANDVEDLNSAIDKAGKTIEQLGNDATQLQNEIDIVKGEINATRNSMKEALKLRNEDEAAFRKAVKDDTDAIALLDQAIEAVQRFYNRNKVDVSLAQHREEPQYTDDPDKAPETTWSGGDYGGRKSETTGVIAILEMIKDDLKREIETSRQDDASAQAQYQKERSGMQDTLNAQTALKVNKERQLNDVEAKLADTEEFKAAKGNDLGAEKKLEDSIYTDCSWVETHFDTRRTQRKAEMDGLVEAKAYLAGVESGDELP
mmetsp:Transcript_83100/g.240066  ORF Transcript_83100/g.240066 Transcript_83100/m.240066 type:complete len:713 (+) Transcript_83100:52-2190(+)